MRGHGSQWISYKIDIRHPLQLKKSKSWEPFRSYQLNSTANLAHLPQIWPNFEVNGLNWQCCLAGNSQRAPRILIFSIAMGAGYLFYMKSIETHARAFLALIILAIGTVNGFIFNFGERYRFVDDFQSQNLSRLSTLLQLLGKWGAGIFADIFQNFSQTKFYCLMENP